MVRQAFDLRSRPLGRQRLEGFDNTPVQFPPPLPQETPVGHLVRQGMLEGVCRRGEQTRLIQDLRCLEVCQAPMQRRLGQFGSGLEQGHGHLGANDGRHLHQAFGLQGEAVQACCQHRLDGVWQQ
jgi:hypothetical protein